MQLNYEEEVDIELGDILICSKNEVFLLTWDDRSDKYRLITLDGFIDSREFNTIYDVAKSHNILRVIKSDDIEIIKRRDNDEEI